MKKLFTNDKFFLAMVILSILCPVCFLVMQLIGKQELLSYNLTLIIFPICNFILYHTYQKHYKNIMKTMIGALLMAIVMSDFAYIPTADAAGPLFLLCDCLLFLSHILINSDRHSSPARIRFSQIVVLAYLAIEIIWTLIGLSGTKTASDVLLLLLSVLTYIATAFIIVCVESRLDAYRLDREAAGWTEETGYPEGYIHEFEKK